ncbi:hypothetical protein SELMODRAFT_417661 [Selaginella moellendorffii]|uniref:Pentacotripeptide-repeat region of PRORP domain-containing protein n=1 Tax=Selaginella moellendorffii TaxID=88036 RepID=D8S361_SELML|nr:hypothetical protein SELMODRAFT_417661 [Selaginella moellendorffii]
MALYLQHGQGEKALELYKTMSVEADELTYVTLLAACGSVGDVEEGRRAHAKITASGFEAVPVVANSLLSMYSKFGRCDEAKVVFEKIQRKEIGAFNSMISALTEHGKFEEALGFFPLMDIDAFSPDSTNDRASGQSSQREKRQNKLGGSALRDGLVRINSRFLLEVHAFFQEGPLIGNWH